MSKQIFSKITLASADTRTRPLTPAAADDRGPSRTLRGRATFLSRNILLYSGPATAYTGAQPKDLLREETLASQLREPSSPQAATSNSLASASNQRPHPRTLPYDRSPGLVCTWTTDPSNPQDCTEWSCQGSHPARRLPSSAPGTSE